MVEQREGVSGTRWTTERSRAEADSSARAWRRTGLTAVLIAAIGLTPLHSQLGAGRTFYIATTADQTANCNELRRVLDAAALQPRGHPNALHVKLGPGAFFCQQTVSIPSWVTVEGSGRATTHVTGSINSPDIGVFDFDSTIAASLRSLSVTNQRTAPFSGTVAVSVFNGSAVLENVEIFRSGATESSTVSGLWVGSDGPSAEVELWSTNIEIFSTSVRTWNFGGGATAKLRGSAVSGGFDISEGGAVECYGTYQGLSLLQTNCTP